jgi:hypothetical protein
VLDLLSLLDDVVRDFDFGPGAADAGQGELPAFSPDLVRTAFLIHPMPVLESPQRFTRCSRERHFLTSGGRRTDLQHAAFTYVYQQSTLRQPEVAVASCRDMDRWIET